MLEHSPVAPPWLVLPMAVVSVLLVLVHLSLLHDPAVRDSMPISRQRLRTAGGVITLFTIVVLAYSFGIVTPADPRAFAMAWLASIGLLGMVVMVATLDAANSLRLHLRECVRQRRHRRDELERLRLTVRELVGREAGAGDVSSGHDR